MRTLRHPRRLNASAGSPCSANTSSADLTLTVQAPAKLNLTLDVLGRRPDGFHELESLMVTVGWFDTLTFAPADGFTLWVTGADGVPTDESNLVTRAATALATIADRSADAAICLHKRIPHEAGLGGGSSDAAAALLGLNELWGCGLSRDELSEVAATIGSDVPFFLCGSAAGVVRGRGERVEPIAAGPPRWALLAKPPVGLSTAAVFAAWGGRPSAASTARAAAAYRSLAPACPRRFQTTWTSRRANWSRCSPRSEPPSNGPGCIAPACPGAGPAASPCAAPPRRPAAPPPCCVAPDPVRWRPCRWPFDTP